MVSTTVSKYWGEEFEEEFRGKCGKGTGLN